MRVMADPATTVNHAVAINEAINALQIGPIAPMSALLLSVDQILSQLGQTSLSVQIGGRWLNFYSGEAPHAAPLARRRAESGFIKFVRRLFRITPPPPQGPPPLREELEQYVIARDFDQ